MEELTREEVIGMIIDNIEDKGKYCGYTCQYMSNVGTCKLALIEMLMSDEKLKKQYLLLRTKSCLALKPIKEK